MDFDSYLEALASAEPTPGGGSAATLVGALGAALSAMVARITLASAKLAPVHEEAHAIAAEADALRLRFLEQRGTDESAFRAVVAAQALPRTDDAANETRRVALQAALTGAAEAPLETARLAAAGIALTVRTAALGNANLMSDVDCSRTFARAAFAASVTNVEVNHRYMTDAATVAQQRERLRELETLAGEP